MKGCDDLLVHTTVVKKAYVLDFTPVTFKKLCRLIRWFLQASAELAHKLQRFSDEQKTCTLLCRKDQGSSPLTKAAVNDYPCWSCPKHGKTMKNITPHPEKIVFVGKNKHIHITISRYDPQIPKRSHHPPMPKHQPITCSQTDAVQGNPRQRNTVAAGRNAQRCAVGAWPMRRSVAGGAGRGSCVPKGRFRVATLGC